MMGEDLTICLQGIKQNKNKNINTKFLNNLLLYYYYTTMNSGSSEEKKQKVFISQQHCCWQEKRFTATNNNKEADASAVVSLPSELLYGTKLY